jgi:hypothetical protein
MTKHEICREIVMRDGNCTNINCQGSAGINKGTACPLHNNDMGYLCTKHDAMRWLEDHPENEVKTSTLSGISLRDYFAGQALSAMSGMAENSVSSYAGMSLEQVATEAYEVADAMLKAREEAE